MEFSIILIEALKHSKIILFLDLQVEALNWENPEQNEPDITGQQKRSKVIMNNIRRKEINKVKEKLENLLADLDGLKSEEEEAYDNMPGELTGKATEVAKCLRI